MRYSEEIKAKAKQSRLEGLTYREIALAFGVPKGTLCDWFKKMDLPTETKKLLEAKMTENLFKARQKSLETRRINRKAYLDSFYFKNQHYKKIIEQPEVSKVALAMLYAGEGSKSYKKVSVRFGNSDPFIIRLFLRLLRRCYDIDSTKFRCTVQCRADQNTRQLEEFWYNVTAIPKTQFYRSRIDPRTIGKSSKNIDYKGVCNIYYFSSVVFFDLMKTIEVIMGR